MNSMPKPADATGYLENLMRAGQDAVKRLDDALATAAGVQSEESASSERLFFPFGLIVYLQRDYLEFLSAQDPRRGVVAHRTP